MANTTTGKRFLAMNELFKTLTAHVEREAKTVASHFRSYAIDMAADATLAKLLTAASDALQAIHEHLERRREDGRPSEAVNSKAVVLVRRTTEGRSWRQCTKCHALECPKCGNVQNLHFLGSECTGCDVCNNLPSLTESSVSDIGNWLVPPGWYFARRGGRLWSCCHGPMGQWHHIEEQSLVYVQQNDKPGYLYCREHAPLHSAPPVGQPVKLQEALASSVDKVETLSFVVSGRVTSDQPFELTLAPDVGMRVHSLMNNAEPGTVQFESVQVEGEEPAPYRELIRDFQAGYVMRCPKGKNVTVRGKLMGVGMSHRLTVQFFGRKLRFD
jgi:hypothetical protein